MRPSVASQLAQTVTAVRWVPVFLLQVSASTIFAEPMFTLFEGSYYINIGSEFLQLLTLHLIAHELQVDAIVGNT